jgi:hypothetical protein
MRLGDLASVNRSMGTGFRVSGQSFRKPRRCIQRPRHDECNLNTHSVILKDIVQILAADETSFAFRHNIKKNYENQGVLYR